MLGISLLEMKRNGFGSSSVHTSLRRGGGKKKAGNAGYDSHVPSSLWNMARRTALVLSVIFLNLSCRASCHVPPPRLLIVNFERSSLDRPGR